MEISKPEFINLGELNWGIISWLTAGVNNLSSIEQLQFLNMPVLDKLVLCKKCNKSDQNKITQFNALNKCSWDSLSSLSLCNSFIYEQLTTQPNNCTSKDLIFSSSSKINRTNCGRFSWVLTDFVKINASCLS